MQVTSSALPTFLFFKDGNQIKNQSQISKEFYLVDKNAVDTKRCELILKELLFDKKEFKVESYDFVPLEKDDLMIHAIKDQSDCLNATKDHNIQDLLSNLKGKYLCSSSDEQLLIFIPFRLRLGLKQISFKSIDNESCPKIIKLFVNKTNLDFDTASTIPADQEIVLTQKQASTKEKILIKNQIKFKSVSFLSVSIID